MTINDIKKNAFSMPFIDPLYTKTIYQMKKREYFIISYETDIDILQRVVPKPLKVINNIVKFEFMNMYDSTGFGSYSESGQVIDVEFEGKEGIYIHAMYLNNLAPISAGREIWGYPKKLAQPSLEVENDTLLGVLKYNSVEVAVGTMGYKYNALNINKVQNDLVAKPIYLLKIIPHPNGKDVSILQLVSCNLTNVHVYEAWSGPVNLELFNHALAPVSALPIKKIVSGNHFIADVTLPGGKVIYDYLK